MSDREVIKLIENEGFVFVRQKGSHKVFKKDKTIIVVPSHGRNLKRGLTAKIIKDAGIDLNKI
ncbi:MAG: type II toxin-antitoxin system HicA family toxin [Minisyncoccia bacterium]